MTRPPSRSSAGLPAVDMNTASTGTPRPAASMASRTALATSAGSVRSGGMKMTTAASTSPEPTTSSTVRR
jgi:hypothetical protein